MKLMLLSDLHFSPWTRWGEFERVVAAAKREQPDYIIISGDIYNCISDFYAAGVKEKSVVALTRLAEAAPILTVLGNHEYAWKTGFRNKKMYRDEELVVALKSVEGLKLLENEWFKADGVDFYGMELDENYYYPKTKRKLGEDGEMLEREVAKVKVNKGAKMKILLFHSPLRLGAVKSDFDLKISGHMHEGEVPEFLQKVWRSERGIIGPGDKLFPKFARNVKKNGEVQVMDTGQIVLPAWETLPVRPRFWQVLRPFYKRKYMILELVEKSVKTVEKIIEK